MIHGILISEGKLMVVDVEDKLEVYYEMLGCRIIDIVDRKIGGQYYSIVCDEEGLFDENSPISMMREGYNQPMLVGSLFICRDGRRGKLTSLTDDDVNFIQDRFKHRVIWGDY